MRGARAKKFRNAVPGNPLARDTRRYLQDRKTGVIICVGARRVYQAMKAIYRSKAHVPTPAL